MNNWNISRFDGKELIINSITFLFYINNEEVLPIQYICMNLNFYIKNSNILLCYNKKKRNLNNYIKKLYGGFIKFINNEMKTHFKIVEDKLVII